MAEPRGPYLVAASYDLTISVTDLSTDYAGVGAPRFGLQNAQANRIIPTVGTRFAVASNPSIFLYDRTAKTNKPIQTLQGHQVNATDLATDGTRLFSSSEDETWKIWDFAQNRPLSSTQATSSLNTIALIHGGAAVVTGNDRGQVEVWGTADGQLLSQNRVSAAGIRSIVAAGTTGLIVVGCIDGLAVTARVNGPDVGDVQKVSAHAQAITRVAASPDGRTFATASADSSAKLWDIETRELKATLVDRNQTRWIWDVVFTEDSATVCTGGTDKVCRVWDAQTGQLKRAIEGHQKGVTCIALLQDAPRAV
jgi:G protein beta subunit-like protein